MLAGRDRRTTAPHPPFRDPARKEEIATDCEPVHIHFDATGRRFPPSTRSPRDGGEPGAPSGRCTYTILLLNDWFLDNGTGTEHFSKLENHPDLRGATALRAELGANR
jgi:hypothetical protein